MKTYKDVYHFPLHNSDMGGWVRDAKSQFVCEFMIGNSLLQANIIEILNGVDKPVKGHVFTHKDGVIEDEDGNGYIRIRGWGNLTGTGGHNLSVEEASNVQDTFAEFIINQLNQNQIK